MNDPPILERTKARPPGVLFVEPDFARSLETGGIADPLDLLTSRLGIPVKPPHEGRETRRFEIGGRAFYLKRYIGARIPREFPLAPSLHGDGPAVREWKVLREALASDLPVARPVAVFERRSRSVVDGFLVTEAIPARTKLEAALLEGVDPRTLVRWARRLGRLVASLHAAGIHHRDLYAGHVLVLDGPSADAPFALVDLNRAKVRRKLGWRLRSKDLAQLDFSVPARLASAAVRLRVLRAYLGSFRGFDVRSLVSRIRRKSRRIRAHVEKKLARGDRNVHLNR